MVDIDSCFTSEKKDRRKKIINLSYKREVGQYFANDYFCTPSCSKRNGYQ